VKNEFSKTTANAQTKTKMSNGTPRFRTSGISFSNIDLPNFLDDEDREHIEKIAKKKLVKR
jgi:hypothetical protein